LVKKRKRGLQQPGTKKRGSSEGREGGRRHRSRGWVSTNFGPRKGEGNPAGEEGERKPPAEEGIPHFVAPRGGKWRNFAGAAKLAVINREEGEKSSKGKDLERTDFPLTMRKFVEKKKTQPTGSRAACRGKKSQTTSVKKKTRFHREGGRLRGNEGVGRGTGSCGALAAVAVRRGKRRG